jgi:hypothetical protein
MRSIMVDFARERLAQHRGGNIQHVAASTDIPDPAAAAEEEVVRVDDALQELARLDGRLVQPLHPTALCEPQTAMAALVHRIRSPDGQPHEQRLWRP